MTQNYAQKKWKVQNHHNWWWTTAGGAADQLFWVQQTHIPEKVEDIIDMADTSLYSHSTCSLLPICKCLIKHVKSQLCSSSSINICVCHEIITFFAHLLFLLFLFLKKHFFCWVTPWSNVLSPANIALHICTCSWEADNFLCKPDPLVNLCQSSTMHNQPHIQ